MPELSRKNISGKVSGMEQLAFVRRAAAADGSGEFVTVNNGGGLGFAIYPECGMGVGEVTVKGINLTPRSCGTLPEIYTRMFAAGKIPGCESSETVQFSPLCEWRGEAYVMEFSGEMLHHTSGGGTLRQSRLISTVAGKNILTVEDRFYNSGSDIAVLPFGSSINFAWPMINESVWLATAEHRIIPVNEAAAAGMKEWCRISAPQECAAEEIFYHGLSPDRTGMSRVMLMNPELKLAASVSFSSTAFPHLFQRKQMQQGQYVLSLLPWNSSPPFLSCAGKYPVPELAPGESTVFKVTIAFEEL